jgi:hypothetical protein
MIEAGQGRPVLMVPGIQGRWEWMRPAIDALSARHRVLSFSLSDVPGTDCFGEWTALIDELLDRRRIARLAVVGVSFGALIALRYAASRPERVTCLVLASAPPPHWALDARRAAYLRRPLLSAPAFALRGVANLLPELLASQPTKAAKTRMLLSHLYRVLRFPASPRRMAAWASAWQALRQDIDCARVQAPALVITGETHLDRVVPTSSTLEYLHLLPNARHVVLPDTGHIGLISRPARFAEVVGEFIREVGREYAMPVPLTLPGPAGVLEALIDEPEGPPRAGVVFAHPLPTHGGTMHTKAVFQGAKGLARIGCAVLRFNFRGVGGSEGAFDEGRGEADDFRAALDFMAARYPGLPLWAAGFSFGSWIALETGADDPRVSVLIGVAPPVKRYDFQRTLASAKPKFFVQGDLDEICPLKDLRAFYAKANEPKEIAVIDGANHLFETKAEEVGEALADLLGDFEP